MGIRYIICSLTTNFGYQLYNVPFNFGYFEYFVSGILVYHYRPPHLTDPDMFYFESSFFCGVNNNYVTCLLYLRQIRNTKLRETLRQT